VVDFHVARLGERIGAPPSTVPPQEVKAMTRRLRLVTGLAALVLLAPSLARANCPNSLPIDQPAGGGHFFTDPSKSYGGWFWMLGRGQNFLSDGDNPPTGEAGIDSGVAGGLPLDSASTWLTDFLGDRATRAVAWDWGSTGSDGCGDLNGNGVADPSEVMAVLVVDSTGSEYAVLSVGGSGAQAFDLSAVTNGLPSAFGTPGNAVPMSPVPKPKFGDVRATAGGKVEVEVVLPGPRDIPTYDDQGGGRPIVQGFQLLQGTALLDESTVSGGRRRITVAPNEPLILRTVFGARGDVGFFVDGTAPIPPVGGGKPKADKDQAPEKPPREAPDDAPGAAGDEVGAEPAAAAGVAGAASASPDVAEASGDSDEDSVADAADNCPKLSNPEQEDTDGDGHGDLCDTCPFADDPQQLDGDGDGLGDRCDACPKDAENNDPDSDKACGKDDNCPDLANPKQENADGDASGDACDKTFDPYVASIEPDQSPAARGAKVPLKLSVRNRSTGKRGMEVRLVLKDAAGKEFAAAADPACLAAVPSVVQLEAGKSWERSCQYVPPKDAASGAATLTLKVKDKEKSDVSAEGTSKLTLR
jgi:thrombospondin type 3 repeat protein